MKRTLRGLCAICVAVLLTSGAINGVAKDTLGQVAKEKAGQAQKAVDAARKAWAGADKELRDNDGYAGDKYDHWLAAQDAAEKALAAAQNALNAIPEGQDLTTRKRLAAQLNELDAIFQVLSSKDCLNLRFSASLLETQERDNGATEAEAKKRAREWVNKRFDDVQEAIDKLPPDKQKNLQGELNAARKKCLDAMTLGALPGKATDTLASLAAPSSTSRDGLRTVTFDALQGRVIVNLPDDMRAGDTISGTVIAEPKGQTPEERTKHEAEMQTAVVAVFAAGSTPSNTPPIVIFDLSKGLLHDGGSPMVTATFTAPHTVNVGLFLMPNEGSPMGACDRSGSMVAIPESCRPVSQLVFDLPTHPSGAVITPDPAIPPTFSIPPLGQTGRPVVITGPFDGNRSTTGLNWTRLRSTVQDFGKDAGIVSGGFGLLAESPRTAVFRVPVQITGPIELSLKEGNVETKGTYRNVDVNLTAPKTKLLKGEKTTLRVEVNGLQGLTQPVPLTLESHGAITMDGGAYQQLVIQPSRVGADGRYATTRGITGVQTGAWTATATVVTHKFDICLQDDTAPARRILWNTFNGDYIFVCPGCWPPRGQQGGAGGTTGESGGTKTGGTTESGGTTTTAGAAGDQGSRTDPPGSLSGKGTVTLKGCIVTLEHNVPGRRIMSRIDQCTKTASASVQTVSPNSPNVKFTITDRSTTDNTCSCGPTCQ